MFLLQTSVFRCLLLETVSFDGVMIWELLQQSPAGKQMLGASVPVWEQFPVSVGVWKPEQEPCVFNCDHD